MKNNFIIPFLSGLIAAMLLSAPLWDKAPIVSALLFFSPAPIFFAALSQGTRSGVIAGIVAVVATIFYSQSANMFLTALILFPPAVWLGHIVGLAKIEEEKNEKKLPESLQEKNNATKQVWYPSESILDYIAFTGFVISWILFFFFGFNIEYFTQEITAIFQAYKEIVEANEEINNIEINPPQIAEGMILWIYIMFPASFAILFIINLLFAARIARRFGGMLRPKDDFATELTMDPVMVIIFVPIFLIALFGNNILFAELLHMFRLLAASMAFCYFIVGLCVIHFVWRFFSMHRITLLFPYMLLLFGIPIFLVAILGLMESIASIRRYITL